MLIRPEKQTDGGAMRRSDFIRRYAYRTGVSVTDNEVILGRLQIGGRVKIAMPCACGDGKYDGWVMVGIEQVLDQLELYAPKRLRRAYLKTIKKLDPG